MIDQHVHAWAWRVTGKSMYDSHGHRCWCRLSAFPQQTSARRWRQLVGKSWTSPTERRSVHSFS